VKIQCSNVVRAYQKVLKEFPSEKTTAINLKLNSEFYYGGSRYFQKISLLDGFMQSELPSMRDASHSCFISVINWLLFNSCLSLLPADREWIRHYRGLWMSPLKTGMVVGGSDPRGFRCSHRRPWRTGGGNERARRELVATDESTVVAKPSFDAAVAEDGQSDGHLPDPARTNENKRGEVLCEANDLLDKLVASKKGSRWRGWGFSGYARFKYKAPVHRWSRLLTRFESERW